eukprot:6182179-Pleurochrysis_carterae.AAC.1
MIEFLCLWDRLRDSTDVALYGVRRGGVTQAYFVRRVEPSKECRTWSIRKVTWVENRLRVSLATTREKATTHTDQ